MTTFLPLMRQSERGDFESCPKKWDWRWNEGYVPINPPLGALWFGTMWHLLWATVYTPPAGADGFTRSLTKPSEIHALWDDLTKESYTSVSGDPYFGDDKELEWNDACALGHIMIDGQLAEWNLDPAYEVLMPESRFSMNIPYTAEQKLKLVASAGKDWTVWGKNPKTVWGKNPKHITKLVGTYDLPIRDHTDHGTPKPKMLDWKTTARRTNEKQLNKDNQTGTYLLTATLALRAMGYISEKETCEYMIFSFARKAKPPEQTKLVDEQGRVRNNPQKNHYQLALKLSDADMKGLKIADLHAISQKMDITVYGEVSKNQGSPLFWRDVVRRNRANRANQLRRIAEEAEVMALMRAGELPITKSPAEHCNWCPFTDVCDIDEDGGDTEVFFNDVFRREDPYADHRAGADNSKKSLLERELSKR